MYFNAKNQGYDPTWQAFKKGDKQAFARIYRSYVSQLLNYGYKVTSDRTLIEDSIQDLFFELWQNKARLSDTTSIRFYLFKALRYKIVRNVKANEWFMTEYLESQEENDVDFSHERYLIELEVQSSQVTHLKELIRKLPQRQQEAVNLRYYHDFSNEEIAHIMGVNYQSACKFIYTALKNLKSNLQLSSVSSAFLLLFSFSLLLN